MFKNIDTAYLHKYDVTYRGFVDDNRYTRVTRFTRHISF